MELIEQIQIGLKRLVEAQEKTEIRVAKTEALIV